MSTRMGNFRRLSGVGALLLGLISMMIGFVGVAGTANATGGGDYTPTRETRTVNGPVECVPGVVKKWTEERTRSYIPGKKETFRTEFTYKKPVTTYAKEYRGKYQKFVSGKVQKRVGYAWTDHGTFDFELWAGGIWGSGSSYWSDWSASRPAATGASGTHNSVSSTYDNGSLRKVSTRYRYQLTETQEKNGAATTTYELKDWTTEVLETPWEKTGERKVSNNDGVAPAYGDWSEWKKVPGSDTTRELTDDEKAKCAGDQPPPKVESVESEKVQNCELKKVTWTVSTYTTPFVRDGGKWVPGQRVLTGTETKSRDMTDAELGVCAGDQPPPKVELVESEKVQDCELNKVTWTVSTYTTPFVREGSEWVPGQRVLTGTETKSRDLTAEEALECSEALPSESTAPPTTPPATTPPTETPDTPGVTEKTPDDKPTVKGVQATAPVAVPTSVEAGLAEELADAKYMPYIWFGAALALVGLVLGFAPVNVRGRYSR